MRTLTGTLFHVKHPSRPAPGRTSRTQFHVKHLRRPVRRGWLVAHVAVSVSWLGLTIGLLTLGITVLKPWGLTKRGRKYRAENRKAVDAVPVRQAT